MMNSKERIKAILDLKTPDRVGIKDLLWDETRSAWQAKLNQDVEEYFGFDIRVWDLEDRVAESRVRDSFDRYGDRFRVLSLREPFQRYADKVGLERALEEIGRNPEGVFAEFKRDLDPLLERALEIFDAGYEFDGLWLFGDLAHSRDLFFSPEFYEKYLFRFHKEICYFFASYGVPTVFHSDGNVARIIPLLIDAGVRALHPVQQSAGLEIGALKKEYGKDLVFFGNIDVDILRYPRKRLREILLTRLEVCKAGGGYIFGLDGPLGPDIALDEYRFVLETVKEHGRY